MSDRSLHCLHWKPEHFQLHIFYTTSQESKPFGSKHSSHLPKGKKDPECFKHLKETGLLTHLPKKQTNRKNKNNIFFPCWYKKREKYMLSLNRKSMLLILIFKLINVSWAKKKYILNSSTTTLMQNVVVLRVHMLQRAYIKRKSPSYP